MGGEVPPCHILSQISCGTERRVFVFIFVGANTYCSRGTPSTDSGKYVVIFLARNEKKPARTESMAGFPEGHVGPLGQDLEVP